MAGARASPAVAAWLTQARRLLAAGLPDEAIVPLRHAAALQPDDPQILHDLGLACLETGRRAEAIQAFRHAVANRPGYTDCWFRLGVSLERTGDLGGAVVAYDRATALLPSHAEAWFRAGAVVFTLGHREEAIGCFRRAASAAPKSGFGRLGAARAFLAEGRDEAAEQCLRRMLALQRDDPMALDLLGNLLAEAGRFDEARDCFAGAIARAPLMAGSYYDLVRCRRVTSDDGDLPARMAAALAHRGLTSEQRQRVHLALGKAADDLGDCGTAMGHFDAADALRSGLAPFDAAGFDTQVSRLIERCTPALMARARALGAADPAPVLIVGLPRSGTTLVEQIVSSHPDVAAGGELAFWGARGASWGQDGVAADDPAFLGQAAADYLGALRAIGPDAARVTDKMPFNVLWAGLIHLACPQATILHCRRVPIDTALSIHQTHFNPRLAFPTGGADLVAYVGSVRRLTDHWRRVLPADRFIDVDYEALTAAPEPAIRRILAACGLAWHAACLHPEHNPGAVRTPSRWQARQPIYRDAVARWRRYEPWLGPLSALLDGENDAGSGTCTEA